MSKYKVGDKVQAKDYALGWCDGVIVGTETIYRIDFNPGGYGNGTKWREAEMREPMRTITQMMQDWIMECEDVKQVKSEQIGIMLDQIIWKKIGEPYSKTFEIPE